MMAVAGSAIPAFAIKWDAQQHKVVVLKSTTWPRSDCHSVASACSLLSRGENAMIAAYDKEMVQQRMFARAAAMQPAQEE
jgi:hypothetical protein